MIKSLGLIGTLALLLVSGGIFAHNLDFLHNPFPWMPGLLYEFLLGLVVGLVVLLLVMIGKKLFLRS